VGKLLLLILPLAPLWSVFLGILLLWFGSFPARSEPAVPVREVQVSELQQTLSLNGVWQLTGPEQQVLHTRVPGAWEQHYAQKRTPHFGTGTYRLRVLFPPAAVGQYFKIYTSLVGGESFTCDVNGLSIGKNGFKANSTSRVVQFTPFRVDTREVMVRCQVHNHKLHSSGLIRPVSLGPVMMMDNMYFKEKMLFNFIVGIFLFLGLFHLLLYAGYRQDKALLWFGFFCLSLGSFSELYNARSLEFLLGDFPIDVSARLTRVAVYAIIPSFFWYVYFTAPQQAQHRYISSAFAKGVTWINGVFLLMLVLPTPVYTPWFALWSLLMIACMFYNIFLLSGLIRIRGIYAFLLSNLLFSVSMINDLLNGIGVLHNGNVSRYGLLLFCLVQAGFLSWRMQYNYQQALQLQAELATVNQNLEGLVSERTQEIQAKNEELHKLVRFKDEMTQMMVHDLKTPLSTLLNLPTQQTILSPEARNSFEVASKRMLTLIENMLNLKQAESSELNLQLKPQRLYTLTKQVFLTVTPWATSKKITLFNQVNPQHQVRVDVLLFERVVLNLLDNAIKHTPIGGEVTISSEMDGPLIHYRIADTGVGIPTALLSKVFDKNQSFTQGQTPRSSGLGLHFCRQIVEAHQGQIAIESSPTGTQVVLSLHACREPLPTNPVWLPQQLQVVRPIAQQLSELEVFEVSKIHAALHELKTSSDQGVLDWLSALEGAVREVNAAAFGRLIAQVIADPQA
jgi:signal transduction histidine kinase